MPRHGERRKMVGFKADADSIKDMDARALAEGLVHRDGKALRSELIRIGLIYALRHMPAGWRPDTDEQTPLGPDLTASQVAADAALAVVATGAP
jgi:hypothetical protein